MIILLSNNPLMRSSLYIGDQVRLVFIDCSIDLLLRKCKKLLKEGWRICVDPMAGYLHRPNPYHTFIMEKSKDDKHPKFAISSLERLIDMEKKRHTEYIDALNKYPMDYQKLDFSIANTSLQSVLNNNRSWG